MKLEPLSEWVCDSCGDIIRRPEDGWVEWRREPQPDDRSLASKFHIVHAVDTSPRNPHSDPAAFQHGNCFMGGGSTVSLADMTGEIGLLKMLAMIDKGELHNESYSGPDVKDFRGWTDMFRRLFVPHYEEARLYFHRIKRADFDALGGASEIATYKEDFLRHLVEQFRDDD